MSGSSSPAVGRPGLPKGSPYPYKTLLVDIDEVGVAKVTLNRPEARNAFNRTLSHEFGHCLAVLDEDDDVRVIVVTGAGKVFCAGAELSGGGGLGGSDEVEPIEGRPPAAELSTAPPASAHWIPALLPPAPPPPCPECQVELVLSLASPHATAAAP